MRAARFFLGVGLATGFWTAAAVTDSNFSICSLLGGSNDCVQAIRLQSDGSVIVAANVSGGPVAGMCNGPREAKGVVIRLAPGGNKVLAAVRLGAELRDLAMDTRDDLYVALGREGVAKVNGDNLQLIWKKDLGGLAARLDATSNGCAVLLYSRDSDSTPGAGQVHVLRPDGGSIGQFSGRHHTLDVAMDGASQTVVTIGWRQANAFDGRRKEPVQIAHLTGRSYNGKEKYHLYDWSTDVNAPDFINKPANNMADTRGYRVEMGGDGKLWAAFECAGGNHIFRYEPRLINGTWADAKNKKAKGDAFHAFHNSRSEHKTFLACYNPATGEYLRGQEFTARLANGRANAVRVKNGAIAGAANGRVFLGGTSAYGLPVNFVPPGTGDYTGGAFVLGLEPGLERRLFCIRFQAGAETRAVDVRNVHGKTVVACGGVTSPKPEPFWTKNALQSEAPPRCGFFAVLNAD